MIQPLATGEVQSLHVWPSGQDTPHRVDEMLLDIEGPVGDRHHGITMSSDIRQRWIYGEGTEIRNNRQVSIVDADELAQIATKLGIEALAPGTIADNICTTGIGGLTALPLMSRLVFANPHDPASHGAVIVLGGENIPRTLAGALVGDRYGTAPEKFPKASIHLRGVTGWVERPGILRPGIAVRVLAPRPTG